MHLSIESDSWSALQSSVTPFLEQAKPRRKQGISLPLYHPAISQGAGVHLREQHGCSGWWPGFAGGHFRARLALQSGAVSFCVLLVSSSPSFPGASMKGTCGPIHCIIQFKLSSCSPVCSHDLWMPHPSAPFHLWSPSKWFIHFFILSLPLPLSLLPFISPSLPHRHTYADKHHMHTDSPLSTSSLQFLRKSSQESPWYSEEPNPPPTFQLLRRSSS